MVDLEPLPKFIHLIANVEQGRRKVRKLLQQQSPDCVPLVFKFGGIKRRVISFIGLEFNDEIFVFDLISCPNMLLDTDLIRLFTTPELVKVIHGGGSYLMDIKVKNGIITRNIFDTHRAFDCISKYNEMPCRRITVAHLHEKLNMFSSELDMDDELDMTLHYPIFVDKTGMDWSKRPAKKDMVLQISAEVNALGKCYIGLCTIGNYFTDIHDFMENRPSTSPRQIRGLQKYPDDNRKIAMSNGIRSGLIDIGQSVLTNTIPIAQLNLIPFYYHDN